MPKYERIVFEASTCFQEGATFIADLERGISIAVSEEKAVDSYNATFECNLDMTMEQTIQLRDWLLKCYPLTNGDR